MDFFDGCRKEIKALREKYYEYDKDLLSKHVQYSSLDEICKKLESSQFSIDLDSWHFECFFKKSEIKRLYVIYSVANADLISRPRFTRWTYYNLLPGSVLCIDDPLYFKYPNLKCGWFYGDKDISLAELSLRIVRSVCSNLKIGGGDVCFFSSSSGACAGIYAASLLKNSMCISVNPSLNISTHWHAGNFTSITGMDLNAPDKLQRNNLLARVKEAKSSHFVFLINCSSERDRLQCSDFFDSLHITPKYGLSQKDNVLLWIYDSPGALSPHSSGETRNTVAFLDYISRKSQDGTLTPHDCEMVLLVNESWYQFFDMKRRFIFREGAVKLRRMLLERYIQELYSISNLPFPVDYDADAKYVRLLLSKDAKLHYEICSFHDTEIHVCIHFEGGWKKYIDFVDLKIFSYNRIPIRLEKNGKGYYLETNDIYNVLDVACTARYLISMTLPMIREKIMPVAKDKMIDESL